MSVSQKTDQFLALLRTPEIVALEPQSGQIHIAPRTTAAENWAGFSERRLSSERTQDHGFFALESDGCKQPVGDINC